LRSPFRASVLAAFPSLRYGAAAARARALAALRAGCVGVAADDLRHHARVRHPQAFEPVQLERRIDHGIGIRAHAAGADGVIDCVGPRADQCVERGIVAEIDRVAILRPEGLQGGCFGDAVRHAHAGAQHRNVAFVIEEVGIDHWSGGGISATQPHGPAAFRAQHAGVQREAMHLHFLTPVIFQHRGDEVPLHIRRRAIRHHRPEPTRLGIGRGHHASALAPVFNDSRCHLERSLERAADRHVAVRLPAGDIVDVILQIAAHRRAVEHHFDPVRLKVIGRTDAGEHQDLRGIERARAQHHAAPRQQRLGRAAAPDLHAGHAPAFDHQLFDQRVGAHIEIARPADRLDIGAGGGPAFALALGDLIEAEAVLPLAVEVRIGAQLQGCGSLDKGAAGGVGGGLVGHEQRAACAMIIITAALVRLGALEVGEHVIIAPPCAAFGRPVVVIPAVSADIDHRVDRRGTTKALPARLIAGAPVQPFLGNGFVAIVRLFGDEGHEARRLDPDVVIAPARFQQAHPARAIHREPARDCAAGTATADDDVVEAFHDLSLWRGD
jgi:hypothetical protein